MDMGSSGNLRELGSQRSTSALQDEVLLLWKLIRFINYISANVELVLLQ